MLQGDYRQLVHELDQYQYCELRLVVLDIRNTYVRHPLPLAYSWPSLTACILNLMIHTPCAICCFHALYFKLSGLGVKYACRVHRRERQLKWNPFLLNRRVIKLIAVLVLNWLALRLPSINQLVSFLRPLSSVFDAANEQGVAGDDERSCLTWLQLHIWTSLSFMTPCKLSVFPISSCSCITLCVFISLFRLCCLTSLTRTLTRLRDPEEMGKRSSTETDSRLVFFVFF